MGRTGLMLAAALLVVALGAGGSLAPSSGKRRGGSGEATQQLSAGDFAIRGRPSRELRPGRSAVFDLELEDLRDHPRAVTLLRVRLSVDEVHREAGCSPRRDFRVRQLRREDYPLRIEPGEPRRLTRLGVRVLPRVWMRNLANVNQDACKGARLTFRYTGRSRRLER